jgi:hypothetical protein
MGTKRLTMTFFLANNGTTAYLSMWEWVLSNSGVRKQQTLKPPPSVLPRGEETIEGMAYLLVSTISG